MKIKAISDIHGYLPEIGPFDVLFICGDVCPIECHRKSYQAYWLNDDFVEWINEMDFIDADSMVVMIPGNHDMYLEKAGKDEIREIEVRTNDRLKILINESYETHGLKIYGCPFCKKFGNWAFSKNYDDLKEMYDAIPEGLDILLTHDAPDIDNLGFIMDGPWAGENAGNKVLAEYIDKKKPKYVFCGHIHTGNQELIDHNGIKMKNVSHVDDGYEEVRDAFSMEL